MISREHTPPHPPTIDMRAPSFGRIRAQAAVGMDPLDVFIGCSAGSMLELTNELIGCWLTVVFGRQFIGSRTDTANEFGTEVFQDALDHELAYYGACVAAIGMLPRARPRRTCSNRLAPPVDGAARFFERMSKIKPVNLISHGLVHAYMNPRSGRAQVWLEQLPGSVEFVAARTARRSSCSMQRNRRVRGSARAAVPIRGQDAVAWYGLGAPDGDPTGIVESVERQIKRNPARRNLDMLVEKNV